jgi:drug efflux transport system permease protein
MAREYERGTMEALMVSPLTVWEIIIGKIAPYFMLGMISLIMSVMVAILVFNVPFGGSLWVLIYVSAIFLISALAVGLVVSTLAKNQLIAAQIILYLGFLPTFFLSGFLFELESMPQLLQWLSYLFPARYFVSAVKTIFLIKDTCAHVFVDTLGIIAFSVVIILVIKIKLKKRLDA